MNPYQRPKPTLDRIEVVVDLTDARDELLVQAHVYGRSQSRRPHLWSEHNIWTGDDARVGMPPADWVHHLLLVGLQDRPASSKELIYGLTGGLGIQDPLF